MNVHSWAYVHRYWLIYYNVLLFTGNDAAACFLMSPPTIFLARFTAKSCFLATLASECCIGIANFARSQCSLLASCLLYDCCNFVVTTVYGQFQLYCLYVRLFQLLPRGAAVLLALEADFPRILTPRNRHQCAFEGETLDHLPQLVRVAIPKRYPQEFPLHPGLPCRKPGPMDAGRPALSLLPLTALIVACPLHSHSVHHHSLRVGGRLPTLGGGQLRLKHPDPL
mmetsp:Transcript_8339/g.14022  ORF Transcript_8339/g.14022 Transcript_8339/m.14022 type:complete len:225 (-) Transcript_8339:422-1096(-)